MNKLAKKLIRLGHQNPDLQENIKPVLDHLTKKSSTKSPFLWMVDRIRDGLYQDRDVNEIKRKTSNPESATLYVDKYNAMEDKEVRAVVAFNARKNEIEVYDALNRQNNKSIDLDITKATNETRNLILDTIETVVG